MRIAFHKAEHPYRSFLAASGALSCLYGVLVLGYVSASPDIGIRCAFSSIIRQVDNRFFAGEAGEIPLPGDDLLRVGDYEVKQGKGRLAQVVLLRSLFDLRHRPSADGTVLRDDPQTGQRLVKVTYLRQSDQAERTVWCRLGTLPLESLAPSILWFILKLGLFVIGALVFWKRPTDPSAAQFFVLCIVTLGAYMGGYHWARIATQPVLLVVFMVCGVLLPAVSLHFYLVFPRPKAFYREYPRRTLAIIYGPPLVFLAALAASYFHARFVGLSHEHFAGAWFVLRTLVEIYLGLAALWYLASVVALVHSFHTAANITERNQVKWIMFGAVLALLPIGYTLYLIGYEPDDFGVGAATWPMFAASFFLTVAFAVSITRYRLMQLDQIVSSGVVYFLLSFAAGLVYYGLVFAGVFATDLLGSQVMAGPSLTQTVWVSASFLVLMVVLDLVRSRFKRALDKRFYRDKYQLDRTLRRMGQAIEQLVDPPTLARRFLQASAELLNVSRGAVYVREGVPPLYRLAGNIGEAPPLAELPPGSPLVECLRERGALLMGPGYPLSAGSAQRQLRFLGGQAAHALAHEGQLLAILVLGAKDLGAFSPEDLNFLSAFSQLAAVALESAEGHRTIEALNHDLRGKVEKISEQQRRILALQTQLMRQGKPDEPPKDGDTAETSAAQTNGDAPAPLIGAAAIVGSSLAMRQLMEMVRKVSATQSAVLIRGESGTGKELLARALHDNSARAGKSYVKVHCAALSSGLLESELFGHVKGAFTGAHRDKVGRFELADGGTLFLDEIGDIGLETQTKLLRVIQEKTFERVGSSDSLTVDVRIIAATHQNLEELIRQGRFREDLYYRLKVIDILVPSLRQRREDIPELALHFLQFFARKCGRNVLEIDDDAMTLLKTYPWPGNIRQLENVMERAVVIAEGATILPSDLPAEVVQHRPAPVAAAEAENFESSVLGSAEMTRGLAAEHAERDRRERERLVRALASARGNKAEAARLLGLARSTLLSRLKKHGLS